MEESLRIGLVQTEIHWEKIDENLSHLGRKLEEFSDEPDIVLLPELFSTGFTMTGKPVSETMDGSAVTWMKERAVEMNCLIGGSLLILEDGKVYNRFIAAFPDGSLKKYDKRHLFSFAGEDQVFEPGADRLVFEFRGFRICPLICYDLRFPVWSRNTEDIDLLLYVANWPDARMLAWDVLLRARAVENLCYVAAVNRVGTDPNGLNYVGHSTVIDPMGATIAEFKKSAQGVMTSKITRRSIRDTREKFQFLEDRDIFEIV